VFSDRSRRRTAGVLGLLLVLLCAWWSWQVHDGRIGDNRFMKRPQTLDGQDVVLSLVEVTAVQGADRYEVEKGTLHLTVLGPTEALTVGEEVSVGGQFSAGPMEVEERWRVGGELRPWKRRLGVLGLLLTGGLLGVGIGREGREWRVRG